MPPMLLLLLALLACEKFCAVFVITVLELLGISLENFSVIERLGKILEKFSSFPSENVPSPCSVS